MTRFATSCQSRIRWTTLIAVGLLLVPGLLLTARQRRKIHHSRRTVAHRRRRHYVRRLHYRRRYTRVHINPDRVRQIQQALVKAGYLRQKPDGIWGTATRDAMRQYQKANGFTPTGLPEAKPLMELGLGPHPLPAGLQPHRPEQTESKADTQTATAQSSPPSKKSSASTQ